MWASSSHPFFETAISQYYGIRTKRRFLSLFTTSILYKNSHNYHSMNNNGALCPPEIYCYKIICLLHFSTNSACSQLSPLPSPSLCHSDQQHYYWSGSVGCGCFETHTLCRGELCDFDKMRNKKAPSLCISVYNILSPPPCNLLISGHFSYRFPSKYIYFGNCKRPSVIFLFLEVV